MSKPSKYYSRPWRTTTLALLVFFSLLSNRTVLADADSDRWKMVQFLNEHLIYTVNAYAKWLNQNVHYEPDKSEDSWAGPMETIKKGTGDCEDFAFLSAAVLKVFGYDPRVIAVGHGKDAHVICIFKRDGVYYAFDNNELNRTNQTSMAAMAKFFQQSMSSEFVLELSLHPNKVHPLFAMKDSGEIIQFSGDQWFTHKSDK